MARQIVNIGSAANDGSGDTLRQAGSKINANFNELYTLLGGDSATAGVTTQVTDSGVTFFGANYNTLLGFVEGASNSNIDLPAASGTLITNTATQTLTNKTLTAPNIDAPIISTLKLNDNDSSHQYTLVTGALTANRNITIPSLSSNDTFTLNNATQTLTNKTLDSATINSPIITNHIYDANGAELFEITATPSAANHFDIANAAAGGMPLLSAHGTDTNISIDFKGRGTGAVVIEKLAYGPTTATTDGNVSQTATYVVCNKGSTLNLTLQDGTVVGEIKYFTNKGAGNAVITPTNFAQGTSATLIQYGACHFIWDGTNWYITGYSRDTDITIA